MGIYRKQERTVAFKVAGLNMIPTGVVVTLDDSSSVTISFSDMASYAPVVGDYYVPFSTTFAFRKAADFESAYELIQESTPQAAVVPAQSI